MNALTTLTTALRGFMVLLVDDSGPLGSWMAAASHRALSRLQMVEQTQALFLRHDFATVLSVEWAKNPRLYSATGDDVLVIRIPGTHEVYTPKPRAKKAKAAAPAEDFNEAWDPTRWRRLDKSSTAPAHVPSAPPEVVAMHCGRKHTLGSFRDLPLIGATDRTEGFTVIHVEQRQCLCGAVLSITTKRLKGNR